MVKENLLSSSTHHKDTTLLCRFGHRMAMNFRMDLNGYFLKAKDQVINYGQPKSLVRSTQ